MTSSRSQKWAILFAVGTTQFAVPFMLSAVGVCLPAIGREFAASAVSLSLVESVFLGVNAMLLLPIGRAADICGRGAVFLIGLVLFALGTLGLAMAPNMTTFLAIRAGQAVGGAMTLATGLALIYDAFPMEETGRALGISVAGIFLGISAGPFLGGLVVSLWGWRALFEVGMLPFVLALLVCLRNLDWRLSPKPGERFDWPGAVTSALAIGLFVWGSAHVDGIPGRWCLFASVLCFAAFLVLEHRSPTPLLQLSLFSANRPFSLGIAAIAILALGAFGIAFLLSLYLQYGKNMTPAQAGLVLVVQPIIQSVVAPLFGRVADRAPAHVLSGVGALLVALGLGLAAGLDGGSSLTTVIGVLVIMGLGTGIFSTPSTLVVMSAVDQTRYGIASAVTGQARTMGMMACMAAVSMVIAAFIGDQPLGPAVFDRYTQAMRLLFTGGCILSLLGAALSFLAGDSRRSRPAA